MKPFLNESETEKTRVNQLNKVFTGQAYFQ